VFGIRASRVRVTLFVAVAAVLLLAVTACGGSKNSSSSASSDTTTTATTSTTDTSSSSSDGTSTTTTSTTTTSTDNSSSSNNISKSCLNFASAASKLGQALASSGSPTADSESLKKYFEGLAGKAPSDIKASFQTLADAVAKYVDGIKGLNLKAGQTPSAADLAKLQTAAAAMSKPDVQAASNRIQAWVKAGCHS
jgi:hypothetical protein